MCMCEMSKIPWNCVRSFFKLVLILDMMSQISLNCARFFFELEQDSFLNLCLFSIKCQRFRQIVHDSFGTPARPHNSFSSFVSWNHNAQVIDA